MSQKRGQVNTIVFPSIEDENITAMEEHAAEQDSKKLLDQIKDPSYTPTIIAAKLKAALVEIQEAKRDRTYQERSRIKISDLGRRTFTEDRFSIVLVSLKLLIEETMPETIPSSAKLVELCLADDVVCEIVKRSGSTIRRRADRLDAFRKMLQDAFMKSLSEGNQLLLHIYGDLMPEIGTIAMSNPYLYLLNEDQVKKFDNLMLEIAEEIGRADEAEKLKKACGSS